MKILNCLRCGSDMDYIGEEKIQLGQTSYLFGDLPNLAAGAMEVDIYCCSKCGKLEFFRPGMEDDDVQVLTDRDFDQKLAGVSKHGVPQVRCPACGRKHDFDYPKCPRCKHQY